MPIIDTKINTFISESFIKDNQEREAKHEPSGKLTASTLYQPLRFQLLKFLGVPRRPIDAYALGKFKRGNDVEEWYVGMLDKMGVLVEAQKEVKYRDAIGFVDAVVDSDQLTFNGGIMPHEVKSVTNAKLRRIGKQGVDHHYKLQACFYAMALNSDFYAVDILSAEDLRPTIYVFETNELRQEIDDLIGKYHEALLKWNTLKAIPECNCHPKVPWTINPNYAMYDEFWMTASQKEILKQLESMELV